MGGQDAVHVVSSVLYFLRRFYACRLDWQEEPQAVTGDSGQHAMHMMTTNETYNNAFPENGRGGVVQHASAQADAFFLHGIQ